SSYIVSMVRVGEATGRLPEVFRGLATQLQFERDIRETVRSALRYPLFVLAAAMAALMAVNLFVTPAFAKVYKGLNAELPLLTRLVMGTSDFLLAWWPVTLGGAALAAVLGVTAMQRPFGRRLWDGLLLRLPVFGALVHQAALARFTKSFGLALGAG
ncbi:MAG: type II secretion system F family protein, partial [Phycisphaerae bacterium]